jgi:hypothetical protein
LRNTIQPDTDLGQAARSPVERHHARQAARVTLSRGGEDVPEVSMLVEPWPVKVLALGNTVHDGGGAEEAAEAVWERTAAAVEASRRDREREIIAAYLLPNPVVETIRTRQLQSH